MQNDLTRGSVWKNLVRFSVPYLISIFLQTFYGLADLFVIGRFNGAPVITAVSVGSQVTHMLTVIIVGLAMGGTVFISNSVGAKDAERTALGIGNTVSIFAVFSAALTLLLILSVNGIVNAVATPEESFRQTRNYLIICFAGVPFITAYNVISGIFRGMGDSKSPMYFVAVSGVINILLDFLFIGPLKMQAAGAAMATVLAQAISVGFAVFTLRRRGIGAELSKSDFRFRKSALLDILKVGVPVAFQDGIIQVSFLVITAIANSRGVDTAAAVGIVEKIISFLFLVPSAMLSSVSVVASQCAGAGRHDRGRRALFYGMAICAVYGAVIAAVFQFAGGPLVGLFAKDEPAVAVLGGQYIRTYVLDCIFAGVHFCFSGYFCAYGRSVLSFIQNVLSACLIRIPGAYLAAKFFPATLYPMGLAAPAGSLFSSILCIVIYLWLKKRSAWEGSNVQERL